MQTKVILEGKIFDSMPNLNQNDTEQLIQFEIKNFDDTVVDLTADTVKFKMKSVASSTNKVDSLCTITDAVNGKCEYQTISADLDEGGDFDAELEVTQGTKVTTVRLGRFEINADLP